MSIKSGQPLKEIDGLPENVVRLSAELSITVAPEFYSMYTQNLKDFSRQLRLSEEELTGLAGIVVGHIPPDELQKIKEIVPRHYPTGAREPYSAEFREYMERHNQE